MNRIRNNEKYKFDISNLSIYKGQIKQKNKIMLEPITNNQYICLV